MRNLKKFLALVLAFMMAMSLMITANAATNSEDLNFSDSNSVTAEFLEDIQVLTGMEVIKGYDDGSFQPKYEINRGQMAAIIYRIATGDVTDARAQYWVGYNPFPDVQDGDYYAGYIGYCASAGYIEGFPDGTFKPMNKVTGYQALAMILRAMGYNHTGDNFTGNDWQSQVSSRAKSNNMLVNIEKTIYNGTFGKPAPRELVAEMTFQGLIQPQVTWTTAFGYQRYGMEGGVLTNVLNPTLGFENFGLTNHKGIVVGNQYTGEKTTKIGFSMDVDIRTGLNIGDNIADTGTYGWTVTGSLANATINDNIDKAAYYYLSGLVHNNGGTAVGDYGVTLAFDWESDLTLFNHAVDVWYDYRGTANETVNLTGANVNGSVTYKTNLKTYAVFDRVQATAVVAANIAAAETDDAGLTAAMRDSGISLKDGAFFNYAFSRNTSSNWGDNTTAATTFEASPIKANNGTAVVESVTGFTTDWPLYLVISNNANKTADVIISLDMTLSKVVQDNNTQAPLSTGILTRNGAGTAYFDQADVKHPTNGSPDYSEIANANRVDSYDAKLGNYVAAVAITGTTGANDGTNTTAQTTAGDTTDGNATAAAPLTSTYYYDMTELTSKVTSNLVKFDKDSQQVTLSNGNVYERSIFALTTDGSFMPTAQVMAPTEPGEYTFYLDEQGNWLFWEKGRSTAEFVYGTYIDYTTKVLSSGFDYPMLYVNSEGEDQQQVNVTGIGGTDNMNNAMYMSLKLPKRTNVGDNSTGFVRGQYIGYILDGSELTAVDDTANPTGFVQAKNVANQFGDANTTITANSVAIGAHPAGDSGNLFLTGRTKFVVVDGAGTLNQKSTVYTGIEAFLNGNQSVTIDVTTDVASTYLYDNAANTAIDDPWQMIYYSTEEDPYAQNYDQMDKHVDTVFIPKDMITWTPAPVSGNLFFVGDSDYGLIDATNNATQYTFYQNEVKSTLWIDGLYDGDDDSDADTVYALGDNVFYLLNDTGRKAVDGGTIYALVAMSSTDANNSIIGQYYGTRTTTADQTTVDAATAGQNYLATTRNSQVAYLGGRTAGDLFNVANASVLNLDADLTINSLGDLNEQSSLTSNQGVDVSCVLGETTNSISFIYVNYVP